MPTSIELRQERARIVESLRAVTDTAETENRNLTGEERQTYDRHEQDFRSITERITRAEAIEAAEADNARSLHDAGIPGGRQQDNVSDENRSKERRSTFLQFVRRGINSVVPEHRALVENQAGEILVPEDLETEILRSLPELTVIRALASQRSLTSNRVRRRSMNEVSVGWGKLETNDQDLTDSMPGTPAEEYTYIEDLYGLAKIGEDEFDDSDVNLEAFIRDSFSRAIGEAEDSAFTIGAGHTSKKPVGIFSTAGGVGSMVSEASTYGTTGANAPSVLVDDLKGLVYAVPAQYRRNGQFLMASTTELAVSTVKDGNGNYLWQPSIQAGRPNTFHGYALNNQEDVDGIAPGKSIAAFGDFNAGYKVYDRQGMTIQRLNELYAEDGMIGFKVRFRVGGDVIQPKALKLLKTKAA
jgi:HK97 family phage major capsid protein